VKATSFTLVVILFARLSLAQLSDLMRLDSLTKLSLNDSTSIAVKYAHQSLLLANQTENKQYQFKALSSLAVAYLINDDYDLALENCLEALELAKVLNHASILAEINTTLGWLYYDVLDAPQALEYHKQALNYFNLTTDSLAICTSWNAIGLCYLLEKKYDKALPYLNKSLSLGLRMGNDERVSAALNNIGETFQGLGKEKEGLMKLQAALPITRRLPDKLREANLQNSIASVLLSLGQLTEARIALAKAHVLCQQSKSNARKETLMTNAMLQVDYFRKTQQYDSAFLAIEKYNSLREQVLSDVKKMNLMNKKTQWETKRSEAELLRLEKERALRVNQRNTIALAIILLTIAGFFVYSRERQLRLREHELAETREVLSKTELEKVELERIALNEKLEFKNRELTNYALHISQRNDLQRAFLDELESFKKAASPDLIQHLNKVVKQFSVQEDINKDAETFHVNVELENKDFFYNLAQKFPNLTENEKRLCAQVRLNLSIKEIASINNISVKAVEMARYRLRKKLNVPHDDNLTEFLRQI